jgi:signal transduction histidine kinase/CheY-like chemotaxis protein
LLLGATIALDARVPTTEGWRRLWLVVTFGITGVLALLLSREVARRASGESSFARATDALRELNVPADVDLADRPIGELLDGTMTRLREVLRAHWSAVALTDGDSGVLRVAVISGEAPFTIGEELDAGNIPGDTASDRLAVPLVLGNDQLGVIEVGAEPGATFTRNEHDLLRILADNLASTIERAHLADAERRSRLGISQARAHLGLIADVSAILSRALEDARPALRATADVIARSIGDNCTIHLTRPDGALERVAARNYYEPAASLSIDELQAQFSKAGDDLRRVMSSGVSELSYITPDGRVNGTDDRMAAAFRSTGLTSWVVAPIRLRGLSLGAMTVATGPNRRGLRASDQAAIDEVAGRVAIAIERGLLYRDTREAAAAAEHRAQQLANLIEAAIAFNRALQPQQLLDALVLQGSKVLRAAHCHAWLTGDAAIEAEVGQHDGGATRTGSALVDPQGRGVGFLTVERDANHPFSGDEESLLLLLARLASVALQNAKLYDDVRLREQRLAALLAASPLAIVELDLDGNIQDTNPAARELLDESGSLPPALAECLTGLMSTAVAGELADREVTIPTDEGGTDLWVSTALLRGRTGAPAGVLALMSDMTERNRLEEQLIEAHRYEAIAQLAGGVAHDFNNLLTIILGYSDLLQQTLPADASERNEITAIHEAGRHAAVITNQLLTLSRNQVLQPVIVPVAEACRSLVPMLQRLAGERVTVVTKCEGDATVRVDPGQLEQVLFNLVLNSRDALPSGGSIYIDIIEQVGPDSGDEVAIRVSDTGEGMSAETLAHCLEPFYTTKGRRGIGLGLATVSSIVQRSGGRLEITSERAVGTTVSAVFPRTAERAALVAVSTHAVRARVLLVDDDELIRRYASQVLIGAGFEVAAVGDAESALAEMANDGDFDLLVSDVVLPAMNGFELARQVGARWPRTARLLMTGYAGTDTGNTGLEDVAVLAKPFAGDDLVRAAGDALVGQDSNR